jgi:hypothetical protein
MAIRRWTAGITAGPIALLLAYSADSYTRWREEAGLPAFPFGAFGENLTLAGVDEDSVCIGDIYRIGDVRPRSLAASPAVRESRAPLAVARSS